VSYRAIREDVAFVGREIKRQKDILSGIAIVYAIVLGLLYLGVVSFKTPPLPKQEELRFYRASAPGLLVVSAAEESPVALCLLVAGRDQNGKCALAGPADAQRWHAADLGPRRIVTRSCADHVIPR
jgi:hypothetical protein